MVMCHLEYQNFHLGNKKLWVKTDDWNIDWCKMVNDNQRYCKTLELGKWMEFVKRCHETDLPSFHPYWKLMVMFDNSVEYRKIIKKL